MNPDRKIRILDQEILYDGFNKLSRLLYRYRRANGAWSDPVEREIFRRGPAAAVLPYDPVRDRLVLIEQFRPGAYLAGTDAWQLEPVAGICEPGEAPEETLRREALEEAGCKVDALVPIVSYHVSPGCVDETVSVYCGRTDASDVASVAGDPGEQEETRVHVLDFGEALENLNAGAYGYALTIISLQWLALNRQDLRKRWLQTPPAT